MRIPRSNAAVEALMWFGLFGPALAFAGEHVIGVGATFAQCNPAGGHGWSIEPHLYQLVSTAVAGGIAVLAWAAAALAFLGSKHVPQEGDPPLGRIRFLSMGALVAAPLFLAIILLNGIGAAVHPICTQA